MPIEIIKNRKDKIILGFIFVSAGSTWYSSSTDAPELIALKAVKECKRSWKHLFKFPKEYVCPVNLFDVSKAHGWNCEKVGEIMPILKSGKLGKKPCKFIKTINVVL